MEHLFTVAHFHFWKRKITGAKTRLCTTYWSGNWEAWNNSTV